MKRNLIVAQSGGPTSVINASLQGVIEEAMNNDAVDEIYGSLNGIDGILHERIIDFRQEDAKEIEKLKYTPSAALGSVRHCLPDQFDDPLYAQILTTFQKYEIHYFFYIGGNDSMDTVDKLYRYFQTIHYDCTVLGIPKTIDNDLPVTDHTPGYGSAIKYIATTIQEIHYDTACYEKGRVTIVEIMGRDAGWLTAGSKLAALFNAGPDLIYLPEVPFDQVQFEEDVARIYRQKQKVLVCVSEGIKNQKGQYVMQDSAYIKDNDVFGHQQLGGTAMVLSHSIKEKLGIPVRAIELNLLQRCASHLASGCDIEEAYEAGKKAVEYALQNKSGQMVYLKRISQNPYQIAYLLCPISKIANQVCYVPSDWIVNGNNLNDQFIDYALPLIQKETNVSYYQGLPSLAKLKKVPVRR